MYPILKTIYEAKSERDLVVLSAGHAGLAQYVAIEEHSKGLIPAEDSLHIMGIHPERNPEKGIMVSSGSLGSAILVCVGLAIADATRNVYCLLSDGECAEGSVWEALSVCTKMNLTHLKPYVNINGFSAYDEVDRTFLETRLKAFCPWVTVCHTTNPEYLGGLNAHYHILKSEDEIQKVMA